MLGSALLKAADVPHLAGSVPEHSILFLVTEDGAVEWRDMQAAALNEKLTDDMIVGEKSGGVPLTVADIAAFARDPKSEGMLFAVQGPSIQNKIPWVKEEQQRYVAVFAPGYGEMMEVLSNEAHDLVVKGHGEEALEVCRQAVALDPLYVNAYINMAHALAQLNRNEEVTEVYRRVIAIEPKISYPYNNLGYAFFCLGRHKEAIECYRQAIDIEPVAQYFTNLGNALDTISRYEEAVEAYRQAVAIDPKDQFLHNSIGNTLRSAGRFDEAIAAYRQAMVVDPGFIFGHYGIGNVLSDAGRDAEAIAAFQTFISLANKEKDARWIGEAEKDIAKLQKRVDALTYDI